MKPTETRVTFIMDKDEWWIIKRIASKHSCAKEDGTIGACGGSDIIRELLGDWLSEQSTEWYPKLLEELKTHNVENRARRIIEEEIKKFKEGE